MISGSSFARRATVLGAALALGATLIGPTSTAGAGPSSSGSTLTRSTAVRLPARAAAARAKYWRDPRNDFVHHRHNWQIDIGGMKGFPQLHPGYVTVVIYGYHFPRCSPKVNMAEVYIDRRGTGPKPDYRVQKLMPCDGDHETYNRFTRVRSWNVRGRVVPCDRLGTYFYPRRNWIVFVIPRACIRSENGRRVRIHTRVWNATRYSADGFPLDGVVDVVPNSPGQTSRFPRHGWF